jgi:hypothetical protein
LNQKDKLIKIVLNNVIFSLAFLVYCINISPFFFLYFEHLKEQKGYRDGEQNGLEGERRGDG